MSVPSTCPECEALLHHTKQAPGGIDAPIEVACPDCEYADTIGD